jgi:hypothetical protein
MSIHWMRELNMHAVPISGQSSEEREHRREAKYGGKLACQAMNMSTSSVRSCCNCMATELVEMYAQVYGRIPEYHTCYWFVSPNDNSHANH